MVALLNVGVAFFSTTTTTLASVPTLSSATIRVRNFKKLQSKMADITSSRVIIKLSELHLGAIKIFVIKRQLDVHIIKKFIPSVPLLFSLFFRPLHMFGHG